LRRDPLSGRLVVVAPGRAKRPGAFPQLEPPPDPDELDDCPFCAGREDRTPPETLRLPAEGAWQVRVVPNLYPAFERQEVVVHTPQHARSITELSNEALALVADAWRTRAEAARAEGFAYVHAIVNEGRAAGASLPHTHSQLVWLREPPPPVLREGEMEGVTDGELVLERDGVVAICPAVSAEPYEMRVAPAERERDAFSSLLLPHALIVAGEAIRRLRAVEPGAPANLWLHDGPWWHLDVVPRLTVAAGIELGAGIHVNPLPPAEAAARLR
jgi:UDPglucose--hexose-1-phosphate uridylyltransferase